jgi:hypothetical protein
MMEAMNIYRKALGITGVINNYFTAVDDYAKNSVLFGILIKKEINKTDAFFLNKINDQSFWRQFNFLCWFSIIKLTLRIKRLRF